MTLCNVVTHQRDLDLGILGAICLPVTGGMLQMVSLMLLLKSSRSEGRYRVCRGDNIRRSGMRWRGAWLG